MRSVGRVTSSNTRARRSWCVVSGSKVQGSSANGRQLDAGMHPAHEGLSAMPFYDEFDLSTVDVLLISQYVYVHSGLHLYRRGRALAHHCSRRRISRELCPAASCISESMEHYLHLTFRLHDVPIPEAPAPVHSRTRPHPLPAISTLRLLRTCANMCSVSTSTMLPPYHMSSQRQTSKAGCS